MIGTMLGKNLMIRLLPKYAAASKEPMTSSLFFPGDNREPIPIHNPITPRSGRREPRLDVLPAQIPVLDKDRGCSCEIVHRVGIRWHGPVSRACSHRFASYRYRFNSIQLAPARDANRSS